MIEMEEAGIACYDALVIGERSAFKNDGGAGNNVVIHIEHRAYDRAGLRLGRRDLLG